MPRKLLTASILVFFAISAATAQNVREFKEVTDSLCTLLKERTGVVTDLKMKLTRIRRDGDKLDFYFSQELGDYPWRKGDVEWFRNQLRSLMPEEYSECELGDIYCKTLRLPVLENPALTSSGKPNGYRYSYEGEDSRSDFVTRVGAMRYPRGLSGRNIALWQSHGRYYDESSLRWRWQRAPVHRTVEDMYTQSYVLPFLIPMLENAGAYVMTPRERDTQAWETVADNDPSFEDARTGMTRLKGRYSESGGWRDAGEGFADAKILYTLSENPFTMGTARKVSCVGESNASARSEAKWSADIPERGFYAVYVSYKSLPESTHYAHYTVRHLGGETSFLVDQAKGGGTWIYLGTFEFDKGGEACVVLDNVISDDLMRGGNVVTADAVRFGGGMGKVVRGPAGTDSLKYTSSGLPSYAEGAIYSMAWSGIPESVHEKWEDDYTKDFASRGAWVQYLKGEKGIPFDLSFAFHSDAGTTPNDSIVGTLSIYTLLADGSRKLPDGKDRIIGRHLADLVQQQVCADIRSSFEPEWTQRQLWDRSYSEARTTGVPGMLLELLSHQNFADMRLGLDPTFRFTVSRAVYKGILKFYSDLYHIPYVVQPLPVSSFAVALESDSALLSWKATDDPAEPTAISKGFLLYTRIDDGAFGEGVRIDAKLENGVYSVSVPLESGHLYSFKLEAWNEGGRSFPSEVLCAGISADSKGKVTVVNNFDRLSPPAWFDSGRYAGFDGRLDMGVPYVSDISYIGENYEFDRSLDWIDDDNPGFGASWSDFAGRKLAGNTFDFVSVHGRAIMAAGYSFDSASRDAFCSGPLPGDGSVAVDLLCGKQVTSTVGRGAVEDRYCVFPAALQETLRSYTSRGGRLLVSGAYIGTDVWSNIYPVSTDIAEKEAAQSFVEDVLGYRWLTNHGSYTHEAVPLENPMVDLDGCSLIISSEAGGPVYCVENPDGIVPAGDDAATVLRYTGNYVSAAVFAEKGDYRVASFGFPLETVTDPGMMNLIFFRSLEFLNARKQ